MSNKIAPSDLIITDGDAPRGFTETPYGLIIPEGAAERPREIWHQGIIKRLDATVAALDKKGIRVILVCDECTEPLKLAEIEEGKNKRLVFRCKHLDRVLRRDL